MLIKKLQTDSRVGRRRAHQTLTGEDESPRSNHQSYPTQFRYKMDPEKKITFNSWAIEKSFTQENGSKPATKKIKQRIRICHRNLKRKRKQNSSNYNVTMFSAILRKGRSWNIRMWQNQPKQRPDIHPRLCHPGYWSLWQQTKRVQPPRREKTTWIKTKNITSNPLLMTLFHEPTRRPRPIGRTFGEMK